MASIDIFTGSALSDRAEQIDAFLVESLPGARLLVPTRDHARQRMLGMLQRGLTNGILGRPVLTFEDFATGLLRGTRFEQELVKEGEQRLLLERIVSGMARDGELDSLGPAARTPGFIAHLHRTIAQLKQSAVEPEQFLAITGRANRDDETDRVVGLAYAAYQNALKAADAYDPQGMYWVANQACAKSLPETLAGLKVLILDGFDDFTESEFRLVQTLASHLEQIIFGLVVDLGRSAEDQGRLVRQTYALIERSFDFARPIEANGREPASDIEYGSLHLFSRDKLFPDPDLPRAIRMIECYNPRHEAEAIAGEIKRAVREGRARLDRIAVVHSGAADAADRFRAVFDGYGIPCNARGGVPLDTGGLGAYIRSLFAAIESWSRHDVLEVIAAPYSGADALNAFDAITRAAGISRGREQWHPRIERFADAARRSDPDYDAPLDHVPDLAAQCDRLLAIVDRLERAADAYPEACRADTLADWVLTALETLGVRDAIESFEPDAREQAHAEWTAIAAALQRLKRWYGAEPVAPEEAARIVRQCFSDVTMPFERARGGVWFGSPADIRHLTFDIVFCASMIEGVFPSKPTGNAIYGEQERTELAGLGIRLRDADWYAHRQTGLFQRIFDCADAELILTWPGTGIRGETLQASPFIEDLQALFRPAFAIDPEKSGTPSHAVLPDPLACGSAREARNLILDAALPFDADALPGLERARLGAEIERRRYASAPFDEYDGILSDSDAIGRLNAKYAGDHRFSASELNAFLQCPFRFFIDRVLRVKTVEEPDDDFDPLLRGLILHRTLETFYASRLGKLLDAPDPAAEADMERALDDAFARWSWATARIPAPVVELERVRLFRRLERYLRQSFAEKKDAGWAPQHLEVRFGRPVTPGCDGLSTDEPFRLDTPAGTILLQGTIDRIDCNDAQTRLIDYKSGQIPARKDITSGSDVQLTLYTLATARHLLPDQPVQSAYYLAPGKDARIDALNGQKWLPEDAIHVATEWVAMAVLALREGRFPLKNADTRCKGCPDGKVCRFEEGRVNRKAP